MKISNLQHLLGSKCICFGNTLDYWLHIWEKDFFLTCGPLPILKSKEKCFTSLARQIY